MSVVRDTVQSESDGLLLYYNRVSGYTINFRSHLEVRRKKGPRPELNMAGDSLYSLVRLLCLLSRGLLLRCRRFGRLFSFSLGRLSRLHFGLFLFSGRRLSGFHIGAGG